MNLIVRVMDYDWGKRDDLLGEVLVDVPELVRQGKEVSFPLMRRGQPGKGEVTLSARYMPFESIFPTKSASGVRVSAVVRKPLCLLVLVHKATGLRKADFIGRNDVYVQMYKAVGETDPQRRLPLPDRTVSYTHLRAHET